MRARLWLAIGALALLPLLLGGVVAGLVVPHVLDSGAGQVGDAADVQRAVIVAALLTSLGALVLGWWIAHGLVAPVSGRSELSDEREESLARLGETLASTHDLDGLLQVVLDTAVLLSGADAGVALVLDGRGFALAAEQGMAGAGIPPPSRVTAGAGVLGAVGAGAGTVRGTLGTGLLEPCAGEPAIGHVLAAPLHRGTRVVGVLGLYRTREAPEFSAKAEQDVRTLAGQASIAVENVLLHREAQRLAITDPLTGLWNFRYLSMSLAREIERANRFDRPLAVLMLDVDRFKAVNDTYGHARGDAVLRELAHRFSEQVREVDTLARYGGEEFVLVLPETDVEGATMLAERMCSAVRREPFRDGGAEPLPVTISIGVAAFPRDGGSPATLMRAADEALYAAKRSGRDTWRLAVTDPERDGTEVHLSCPRPAPEDLG